MTDGKYDSPVWVKIADLRMDWSYQRPTSGTRVRRIVREFDVRRLGVITVSRRDDGEQFVVDGSHRVAVLKAMGERDEILADVWDGLSVRDEAELFTLTNGDQKKPTAVENFRAQVVAEYAPAVIVNACMVAADWTGIRCVAAMVSAIEAGMDPTALETALKILKPARDNYTKTGTVLMGLAMLLDRIPAETVNGPRMTDKVLIEKYRDVNVGFSRLGEMGSGDRAGKAAEVLRQVYNTTRGTKIFPPSED
jgi:hypothetical protein